MPTSAFLGVSAVPLITGAIQVLKSAGLPPRFAPFLAVLLGLADGIVTAWLSRPAGLEDPGTAVTAIVLGLSWGLAASGLYEGTRRAGGLAKTRTNTRSAPPSPAAKLASMGPLPPKP